MAGTDSPCRFSVGLLPVMGFPGALRHLHLRKYEHGHSQDSFIISSVLILPCFPNNGNDKNRFCRSGFNVA